MRSLLLILLLSGCCADNDGLSDLDILVYELSVSCASEQEACEMGYVVRRAAACIKQPALAVRRNCLANATRMNNEHD